MADDRRSHPSLRRRLLVVLMLPMLIVLVLFGSALFVFATRFDRLEHDRALRQDVESLARLMQAEPAVQPLPPRVQSLLTYDSEGRSYFAVQSAQFGDLSGREHFPRPARLPAIGGESAVYETIIDGSRVRAAVARVVPPYAPDDVITAYWAETLDGERRRSQQVLGIVVTLIAVLAAAIVGLAWLGVDAGLRSLRPLTERIASRQRDLSPVTDRDVPGEIVPLTRTIDGLFSRLQAALSAQERFLADAAHQLRTPLAGLRLHAERALAAPAEPATRDALLQIAELTQRAGRTAQQLLALNRAESLLQSTLCREPVDLAALARAVATARVDDARRARVDIGYHGPEAGPCVAADPAALHEALDNLVDNALRYAGSGSIVTVCVEDRSGGPSVWVEDNGPGVRDVDLPRLGERFFRPAATQAEGTGLGLAIVRTIAAQNGADLWIEKIPSGGLRVGLRFPNGLKD